MLAKSLKSICEGIQNICTPPKQSLDQTEIILSISKTVKTICKVQEKFLWWSFFYTSLVKVCVFIKSSLKVYLYE